MGKLFSAMNDYAGGGYARFHIPGHKGAPLPYPGFGGISALDLTEVAGLDSLYTADGVIRNTEEVCSRLYGSLDSFISAGGSTLCIQAMLATATRPGDTLIISRGTHTAAVNAMALLDLNPEWMLPASDPVSGLSLGVTALDVQKAVERCPDAAAVYLTSPTFFGALSDIAGISKICREYGVPLLVDNAHGAHLAFFKPNLHPMANGADICCDSLHKTLPVLTGGAVLHIGREEYINHARKRLALFGSTSPSYLVMASIDGALDWLSGETAAGQLQTSAKTLEEVGTFAGELGYTISKSEPLKLTIGAGTLGYTGEEFGGYLRGEGIEPEYSGGGICVLMASPFNPPEDFVRLKAALKSLPVRKPVLPPGLPGILPRQVMSIRQAVFGRQEVLPVEMAAGRVCGGLVAPCPPGIALIVAGEEISADSAALLKNYGISFVSVV